MGDEVKYEMSLNDLVSGKLVNAEHNALKLETRLGSVHSALGKLGEKFLQVSEYLGIYSMFSDLKEFAHEGMEMAHQLGQAEAQVKAGLISTNYAAGVSYEDLEESAKKFAAVLPYTQAQIVDMQSQIVTFPGITKKTFDTASQSIMDMSTRLHKGLDETAIMVGKALQDPAKGITAMRRVGVNFNEEQTKIIKNLVATGHAGKAQAMILGELQTEFAGSAKAAADADPLFRYNKLMNSIKLEVGEAGEALLHDLTPGLETIAGWFKTGYDAVKTFSSYLKDHMHPILREIKDDAIALGAGVATAGALFLAANPGIIVYGASLVIDTIATAGLAVATGVMTAAQWALNIALDANPIGLIVIAVGALVTGLVYAYKHSIVFREVIATVMELGRQMVPIFKGLGDVIIGAFTFDPAQIKRGVEEVKSGISNFSLDKAAAKAVHDVVADQRAMDAEDKHQTTMGKLADKRKQGLPIASQKSPGTTSKVTGSKVLNINIHIGALIKELKIQTTNFKEGVGKAQSMVTEALLMAVNDSQLVAGD